ncbi:DUF4185 domain-containing protein [Mycolicibacterium fortuitum]|nr:DUF4185 domain-containing protein [Mycolicibacterium fortuitum]
MQHLSQAVPGAVRQRRQRCRDADRPAPQGPWGPEQLIAPSSQIPGGIYAPYLHPWSTGKELYYNLSLWSAYNVMLMKTVLP